MTAKTIRCAIYTRKSTEEGLDQAFNSLDAQREACESYIASQRHEGWKVLPKKYDDGGFSGGNVQRPALQELLKDIADGKIDSVIVYKIDRLTRSLTDFTKMVEVFDKQSTSFVSVTQHFNTTTSMGRLTLNVLLSFAQFEREVTGERIRDKIAQSKRKGMWMGGALPLGYDVKDRALVVNKAEADLVRLIFTRYEVLGCVQRLKAELDAQGIKSKVRTNKHGIKSGGRQFSRGALYWLLRNRVYRGETHHAGAYYPGQHKAIIDETLWESVQAKLEENRNGNELTGRSGERSLLTGLLYLEDGTPLTPTHTMKAGKRYRYYIPRRPKADETSNSMPDIRLPAHQLECLAEQAWKSILRQVTSHTEPDPSTRSSLSIGAKTLANNWDAIPLTQKREYLLGSATKVQILPENLTVSADMALLVRKILGVPVGEPKPCGDRASVNLCTKTLKRPKGEIQIVETDSTQDLELANEVRLSLLSRIARGRALANEIIWNDTVSLKDICKREACTQSYLYDILRAGCLMPRMVDSLVNSVTQNTLTSKYFKDAFPVDWAVQSNELNLRSKSCLKLHDSKR
jgi:DNA invertase Pin-like site-specific DNA recombinase